MTGVQSLIARAALGSTAAIACAVAISSRNLLGRSRRTFDALVIGGLVVSRLVLYSIIFLLLRITPRGDIPDGYTPQGFSALHGLLIYRDYPTSYAPLHPYLDALVLLVWPSSLAIILFAVVVEWLILPVWLRTSRDFLPERDVRIAALLYLFSPLSIQYVTVDGQDNVVIALFLALAVLLLLRNRMVLSGLCVAITISVFKFLPLIYIPSFFLAIKRQRWNWIAALSLPILVVYGGFILIHAPVWWPVGYEGAMRKASNLPFIVDSLTGKLFPARLWDCLVVIALGSLIFVIAQVMRKADGPTRLRVLTFSMPAATFVVLLFSKKSWPPYLMLTLFPICLVLSNGAAWKKFAFLFFSIVALVEHSFWTIRLGEVGALGFHARLLAGDPIALEFLALEILLLSGYGWLIVESIQRIVHSSAEEVTESPVEVIRGFNEIPSSPPQVTASYRSS
jgi:Glycosyltransferase family 87